MLEINGAGEVVVVVGGGEGGGSGGGSGGGDGGGLGGGANVVIEVGATKAEMVRFACAFSFAVKSVTFETTNKVSTVAVSANVVVSTVNSIFTEEVESESFLLPITTGDTSVTLVILIALTETDKYSAMPVLNAVCLSPSNSIAE